MVEKLSPPKKYLYLQRDPIHPELVHVERVRPDRATSHTLIGADKVLLFNNAGQDIIGYFWRRLRPCLAADEPTLYADIRRKVWRILWQPELSASPFEILAGLNGILHDRWLKRGTLPSAIEASVPLHIYAAIIMPMDQNRYGSVTLKDFLEINNLANSNGSKFTIVPEERA